MMDNMWLDGAIQAIKALAFVCDIITYPVYLLLQRPWDKKQLSRRPKVRHRQTSQEENIERHSILFKCRLLLFWCSTSLLLLLNKWKVTSLGGIPGGYTDIFSDGLCHLVLKFFLTKCLWRRNERKRLLIRMFIIVNKSQLVLAL